MGYETALRKSWQELGQLKAPLEVSVKFLGDEYSVDILKQKVISLSCNVPAKDFTAIIILHYLAAYLKGLPPLIGQWASFKELAGIEGYADAFRQRVIEPVIRKYGKHPQGLFAVTEKLPAQKIEMADAAIVVGVFEGVPVLVEIWEADEEFSAEAAILFDKNIAEIFCIEDIVVLAGIVAHQL